MPIRRIDVRLGANAVPVGDLIYEAAAGKETSVFTYHASWLDNPNAFALAPGLPLQDTRYYGTKVGNASALPGPIADGSPDSWGQAVLKAELGKRLQSDLDFLLEADDTLRTGALRYFDVPGEEGRALALPRQAGRVPIPRLLDLDALIVEARAFEADPARYRENRAKMLYGGLLRDAVGSLGGARPKVNAADEDGVLWIVKLPKMEDSYAVARAEVLALTLAAQVGIRASAARVLTTNQRFAVAAIRRFDRGPQRSGTMARIPFISAQTFLGLQGSEPGNYVDLAFAMRSHCAEPKVEMRELFRRVLFGILINNTDDHLRNHGFLAAEKGKWRLSPAFDVNPDPDGGFLKTAISDIHGNRPSVSALVEVAPYFEVTENEARTMAVDMAGVISKEWKQIGTRLGLTSGDVQAITPALDGPQVHEAMSLARTVMAARTPGRS